jgi:hypothetical protein
VVVVVVGGAFDDETLKKEEEPLLCPAFNVAGPAVAPPSDAVLGASLSLLPVRTSVHACLDAIAILFLFFVLAADSKGEF